MASLVIWLITYLVSGWVSQLLVHGCYHASLPDGVRSASISSSSKLNRVGRAGGHIKKRAPAPKAERLAACRRGSAPSRVTPSRGPVPALQPNRPAGGKAFVRTTRAPH